MPAVLELEERDGSAWITLSPFRVSGLRLRGLPPLPVLSSFHELNCRTYVRRGDRPGVWFFSLDASSAPAVAAARLLYRLPYRRARFSFDAGGYAVATRAGSFVARYQPALDGRPARPGTIEHWLVERYCLYGDRGRLRAEIHHPPWRLERVEPMVRHAGISPVPLEGPPLCHAAAAQHVLVWAPERIDPEE